MNEVIKSERAKNKRKITRNNLKILSKMAANIPHSVNF